MCSGFVRALDATLSNYVCLLAGRARSPAWLALRVPAAARLGWTSASGSWSSSTAAPTCARATYGCRVPGATPRAARPRTAPAAVGPRLHIVRSVRTVADAAPSLLSQRRHATLSLPLAQAGAAPRAEARARLARSRRRPSRWLRPAHFASPRPGRWAATKALCTPAARGLRRCFNAAAASLSLSCRPGRGGSLPRTPAALSLALTWPQQVISMGKNRQISDFSSHCRRRFSATWLLREAVFSCRSFQKCSTNRNAVRTPK